MKLLAHRRIWGVSWGVLASLLLVFCTGTQLHADTAPMIKDVIVVGNVYVKSEDIKIRMRSRAGTMLNPETVKEDFDRLWKMNSFSDVQIQQETLDDGVRLRVVVKEKDVIRRVVFRGNKQVSTKTLKGMIASTVGKNYDPGVVQRDVNSIQDWYRNEYYYFTKVESRIEPFEGGVRLVFDIDEQGRVVVKDVIFHGNDSIDTKELFESMATKPSGFFNRTRYDRKVFEQDLERVRMLYQSKGFLDAEIKERPFQITENVAENKWGKQVIYIHIDVNEGEKWHVGKITFNVNAASDDKAVYSDEEMLKLIDTLPGQPYSPLTAAKDARKIRDFYGKEGRIFTRVSPEQVLPDEGTVVDLVFNVKESEKVIFEELVVTGLVKTQEKVVRREVEIYPGETFDSEKMEETVRNLNRLAYFKRPIKWDVKPGSAPDRAIAVMELEERPTGQLSFGVGVSSNDGVLGSITLKERNFDHSNRPENFKDLISGDAFKGAGEYFATSIAMGSDSKRATVDFTNPWILNRPLRFGTGVFYKDNEWDTYDESRIGAYALLGQHVFGKNWDLMGKYKLENIDISSVDDDASSAIRAEGGESWVSRIELKLTYDTRDDIFQPEKGWYAYASQELAGSFLGGTRDFWRSHAEANYFWTFFRDSQKRAHTLAFRGEVGVADAYGDDETVPLFDRWYAGGIGSLRGYDYRSVSPRDASSEDEVGGENMITASAEYFFPILSDKIRGSLYYDWGGVRSDAGNWSGDTRSSAGIGVHLSTPLGPMPVRIYYNKTLDDEDGDDTSSVQFTFGAWF